MAEGKERVDKVVCTRCHKPDEIYSDIQYCANCGAETKRWTYERLTFGKDPDTKNVCVNGHDTNLIKPSDNNCRICGKTLIKIAAA